MLKLTVLKNKAVLILSVFLMAGLVGQSFAQENESDEIETVASEDEAEEAEEAVEEVVPQKTKEEIAAEKAAKKAEKLAAKQKAREKQDSYLGITYVPAGKIRINNGNLRLDFKKSTGTFNISVKNEQGKYLSLLSQKDSSRNTSFYAKISGTDYKLNQAAGIDRTLRKISDEEVQLVYTLAKKAQIAVDFTPVSSSDAVASDMVKVTVYSTNLTENELRISLKAVFDTILGEASENHFITTADTKIRGAKQYSSMSKERTVISTDGITSVQFVLDGNTVASPEWVSFLNKDSLISGPWVPVVTEGRSFNSVLAYNNSAMAVNWPEEKYKPGETKTITFYIAAGTDRNMPNGLAFVDPEEKGNLKSNIRAAGFPELDYAVPQITDAQLDPVYVQDLINRINALKSDPDSVNRKEVRQLSAELDAINAQLRKKN